MAYLGIGDRMGGGSSDFSQVFFSGPLRYPSEESYDQDRKPHEQRSPGNPCDGSRHCKERVMK
jgi:hypothetical protein